MNKKELIELTAEKTCGCYKKKDIEIITNAVLAGIETALKNGDSVQLLGFGAFKVNERSARECRNPQTGDVISVPAKKVIKFSAGKKILDEINS